MNLPSQIRVISVHDWLSITLLLFPVVPRFWPIDYFWRRPRTCCTAATRTTSFPCSFITALSPMKSVPFVRYESSRPMSRGLLHHVVDKSDTDYYRIRDTSDVLHGLAHNHGIGLETRTSSVDAGKRLRFLHRGHSAAEKSSSIPTGYS